MFQQYMFSSCHCSINSPHQTSNVIAALKANWARLWHALVDGRVVISEDLVVGAPRSMSIILSVPHAHSFLATCVPLPFAIRILVQQYYLQKQYDWGSTSQFLQVRGSNIRSKLAQIKRSKVFRFWIKYKIKNKSHMRSPNFWGGGGDGIGSMEGEHKDKLTCEAVWGWEGDGDGACVAVPWKENTRTSRHEDGKGMGMGWGGACVTIPCTWAPPRIGCGQIPAAAFN